MKCRDFIKIVVVVIGATVIPLEESNVADRQLIKVNNNARWYLDTHSLKKLSMGLKKLK